MQDQTDWSIFERFYNDCTWSAGETVSGPGSTLSGTAPLRQRLEDTFRLLCIRSIVDAGCGDMNWMRRIAYPFEKYIGIDVVGALVGKLRNEKFSAVYHFQTGNIATDILPKADAILCRDCLVHLPFAAIMETSRLWKLAGFRFVFVTTFPGRTENLDCEIAGWRPLNMEIAPFNWPKPLLMISEEHPPPFEDKSIGVRIPQ
jgi:SAM-dependent methyltransferase